MESNEKLSIREYYSAWYGIASALLLIVFFISLVLPMMKFTTQAGTVFSPHGYAFIFGYSVNLPELNMGLVEFAKFNIMMAIPVGLVVLSMILFLCSKFSVWFGLMGAASLIIAGGLLTQSTNFDFYGKALLSSYVSLVRNSKTTRQPGYYLSFISLFVTAAVSVLLMLIMRLKARSKFDKAKQDINSVGIATYYRNKKPSKK